MPVVAWIKSLAPDFSLVQYWATCGSESRGILSSNKLIVTFTLILSNNENILKLIYVSIIHCLLNLEGGSENNQAIDWSLFNSTEGASEPWKPVDQLSSWVSKTSSPCQLPVLVLVCIGMLHLFKQMSLLTGTRNIEKEERSK